MCDLRRHCCYCCCCRFADPGYYEGDPEDEEAPDPLTAALSNKEAYQHIRALPAHTGSAVLFTHRSGKEHVYVLLHALDKHL